MIKSRDIQKLILMLIVMLMVNSLYAQLYFPNEQYYNSEIERYNLKKNKTLGYYQKHLTIKPILNYKTNSDSIYHSDGNYYYWITQKLFKENFLIFEGDDFWVAVDPIVDLELGTDLSEDSLRRFFWNTRGVRVQAKFFNRVAFTTMVYENQATVPTYQSNFFNAHGELLPKTNGYKKVNAFVPMYARTKPFKINGYDFAFAEGQVSIVANQNLNFQFGNGSQFIGSGYRSLFLSDFSGNYPFLKTEIFAFKGRLQYNVIYAQLTNPYRLKYFTTPEATYERKIGVFHHLDFAVTPELNINLFEGSQWRSTDSLGTHTPDYLFVNPIIGFNSILKGSETNNYNSILGIGFDYLLPNIRGSQTKLYSQIVIDHQNIGAYQFGFKIYDIIPKLDLRVEYNHLSKNVYLSQQLRYNYTHNSFGLAHPIGPETDELIGILNYQFKRFFIYNKLVFYSHTQIDSLNIETAYSNTSSNINNPNNYNLNVFNNTFEFGYRFNKNYNLQAVIGLLYRKEIRKALDFTETSYVYFGIRTKLRNKKLDW
jgi:hypothetical protein